MLKEESVVLNTTKIATTLVLNGIFEKEEKKFLR
ncbi:MAG: hypothetical protein RI883_2157 [Bacteroidota bacterium]|jgi:hypothetical protein